MSVGGQKKRKEKDEMQILLGTERKGIWSKDANSPIISGNGKVWLEEEEEEDEKTASGLYFEILGEFCVNELIALT